MNNGAGRLYCKSIDWARERIFITSNCRQNVEKKETEAGRNADGVMTAWAVLGPD